MRKRRASRRTMVLSEHDQRDWHASFLAGRRPTAWPYGVEALEDRGYALTSPRSQPRSLARIGRAIDHRLNMPATLAVRGAAEAARSELVLALLERQGLGPSWAKRHGVPPYSGRPLVVWSCWLADQLARSSSDARRDIARAYAGADLIVHLSTLETEVFLDAGWSAEQLFAMTYGVASDFYTPGEASRDLDVVAVGQDRGRDYATLFEAVDGLDLTVDVVCRPENLAGLTAPTNVRVHGTVDHARYRDLLRRAKILVVPTREMAYPTGSSVALEAASCGACVVVTGTAPMREYFSDGETGILVPVGEPDALAAALLGAMADDGLRTRLGEAARRSVVDRFNTRHMWHEIDDVLVARGIVSLRSS